MLLGFVGAQAPAAAAQLSVKQDYTPMIDRFLLSLTTGRKVLLSIAVPAMTAYLLSMSRQGRKTIAPDKGSAVRGYGRRMISSFFLPVWRVFGAPNRKEKEARVCVSSPTPGEGRGGLARGYYHAASPRLRKGEPLERVVRQLTIMVFTSHKDK